MIKVSKKIIWVVGGVALVLVGMYFLRSTFVKKVEINEVGAGEKILLGAIRFDAWFSPPNLGDEELIADPKYRERLPFYAKVNSERVEVRGDSQEVVDQEIKSAADNGIDYWAFVYYGDVGPVKGDVLDPREIYVSAADLNFGLRYYLRSERKNQLKFALILGPNHLGKNLEDIDNRYIPNVIMLLKDEQYVRVVGDRPIVYFFGSIDKGLFGDGDGLISDEEYEQFAHFVEKFKASCSEAGISPYLVWMQPNASVEVIDQLGIDAIGGYTMSGRGSTGDDNSYASLLLSNEYYWKKAKESGMQVVPTINAGWDYRPKLQRARNENMSGPTYKQPSPTELGEGVVKMLSWIRSNPGSVESRTGLIYAWNEYAEGGWISPMKLGGDERLKAIAEARKIFFGEDVGYEQYRGDNNLGLVASRRYGGARLALRWSGSYVDKIGFRQYYLSLRSVVEGKRYVGLNMKNNNKYTLLIPKAIPDGYYYVRIQAGFENGYVFRERLLRIIDGKVQPYN